MPYVLTRIARAALAAALSVTIVFFALRSAGDVAAMLVPVDATAAAVEAIRAKWQLDAPLWRQFLTYTANVFGGDLGISMRNGTPVADLIAARIPVTLMLGCSALLFALLIGVPLGVMAAIRQGQALDRAIIATAVVGYALPNIFLGIVLILIFAMNLRWLPSAGAEGPAHLVMPALTLGTSMAGVVARFTRAAMTEALRQPYMGAAMARGMSRTEAVWYEALPNAAIPVVTALGFIVGGLIGGAVVVETLFAWPGLGQLLAIAVAARDLPVVQAIVLLTALSMVTTNLIVDLLYAVLDPRVRLGASGGAS